MKGNKKEGRKDRGEERGKKGGKRQEGGKVGVEDKCTHFAIWDNL